MLQFVLEHEHLPSIALAPVTAATTTTTTRAFHRRRASILRLPTAVGPATTGRCVSPGLEDEVLENGKGVLELRGGRGLQYEYGWEYRQERGWEWGLGSQQLRELE